MVERTPKIARLAKNEAEQVVRLRIGGLVLQRKVEAGSREPQVALSERFHGLVVLRFGAWPYRRRRTHAWTSSGGLFQNKAKGVIALPHVWFDAEGSLNGVSRTL